MLLSSWKEIAKYLRCGIRTAQRWEKLSGLPLHRPTGQQRSGVFAFTQDLDVWLTRVSTSSTRGKAAFSEAVPSWIHDSVKLNLWPSWAVHTSTLRFISVNHAASEMLGYEKGELLRMSLREVTFPESLPQIQKLPRSKEGVFNTSFRRKDGVAVGATIKYVHTIIDADVLLRLVLVTEIRNGNAYRLGGRKEK